jgi:hypothetical protein
MPRFLHNGDLGDCIACLPAVRQLGGGEMIFTQKPNPRDFRNSMTILKPLFLAQDYIESVSWVDTPQGIDYNFCTFRSSWKANTSLAGVQAAHCGLRYVDYSPWLFAEPNPETNGRVLVARSHRYRNPKFPWKELAERYGDRMLFIGLYPEHKDFQDIVGRSVERREVKDFLELASLMTGADYFIGNQSSPMWVAMGLGVPLLQETNLHLYDSIVARPNAQFFRQPIDFNQLPP